MGKFLSSNLNFTVNLGGNLFLTRHSHDGVQALKRCLLHALVVWLHRRTRFGKLIVGKYVAVELVNRCIMLLLAVA